MTRFIPQFSFGRGEVSPQLYGRADLQQMTVAVKKAENFQVLRSGGLVNRAGSGFVGEIKNSATVARLIPFQFNTEQAYALEFGHEYMRVVKDGGYMVLASTPAAWSGATSYAVGDYCSSGGVNYYCKTAHTSGGSFDATKWYALTGLIVEIPTPYAAADLPKLKYIQSADTMTLTHTSYGQRELSRRSHTQWVMSEVAYSTTITAPSSVTGTASQAGGGTLSEPDAYSMAYYYVVTTVDADGNESLGSTPVGVLSKAMGYAASSGTPYVYPNIKITWAAVTGAKEYNIYRRYQGLYALIGTVEAGGTLALVDDNITPDPNNGPPVEQNPFTTDGNPQCACYFDDRIFFGGMSGSVQELALSQVGNYHNFNMSKPLKDGDGFTRKLAGRQVCEIRHLVPVRELIVFTSGSIWKVSAGSQTDSITPASMNSKEQVSIGCSHVPPIVIGDRALFVQDMGCVVRDIGYEFAKDNYAGDDISLFSSHMFNGYELSEWAYAPIPNSQVYAVRSDGVMLCLTYLKEQEMVAWTRLVTDGAYESVCAIPEGKETAVYAIVRRTIDGETKRYTERFKSRQVTDISDAWFVDSGLEYEGTPITTLSGLDHLEGKTVAILADGAVMPQQVVTGGEITLPVAASHVVAGLPYNSTMETLSIGDAQGGIGLRKKAVLVRARVAYSRGMWVGPDANNMTEMKRQDWTTGLITDEVELGIIPAFKEDYTITVEQRDPLPMTLLSLIPKVEV